MSAHRGLHSKFPMVTMLTANTLRTKSGSNSGSIKATSSGPHPLGAPPKAGDAPHEGLLKVERRVLRVLCVLCVLGVWGVWGVRVEETDFWPKPIIFVPIHPPACCREGFSHPHFRRTLKCSRLSCEARANCPGLQQHNQNSTKRHPERGKKERNFGRSGGGGVGGRG